MTVYRAMALFLFLVFPRAAQTGSVDEPIGFATEPTANPGVLFPRLTAYPNPVVLEKVNRRIDRFTRGLRCDPPGTYTVKAEVRYAERDLFSVYATAAYFCGGAYPVNDENISLTFDLLTGDAIAFESLFQNYTRDREKIVRAAFGPLIDRAERRRNSGTATTACDGDPGIYTVDRFMDSTFAFNFSAEGLQIQPQWPHVIEACARQVTVPYAKLRPYAAGALARVLTRRP